MSTTTTASPMAQSASPDIHIFLNPDVVAVDKTTPQTESGPVYLSLMGIYDTKTKDFQFVSSFGNMDDEDADSRNSAFVEWITKEEKQSRSALGQVKMLWKRIMPNRSQRAQTSSKFLTAENKAEDAFMKGDLTAMGEAYKEALEAAITSFGEQKYEIASKCEVMPDVRKEDTDNLLHARPSDYTVPSVNGTDVQARPILVLWSDNTARIEYGLKGSTEDRQAVEKYVERLEHLINRVHPSVSLSDWTLLETILPGRIESGLAHATSLANSLQKTDLLAEVATSAPTGEGATGV